MILALVSGILPAVTRPNCTVTVKNGAVRALSLQHYN